MLIRNEKDKIQPISLNNTSQNARTKQPKLVVEKEFIDDGTDAVLFSFESLEAARKHEKLKINKAKKQGNQLKRPMPLEKGFLYCAKTKAIICEKQIECLKIGFSTRNPKVRILELNEDSHIDLEYFEIEKPVLPMYPNMVFELVKYYQIKGCYEIEQLIHAELIKNEHWLWAELFTISLDEVDSIIKKHIPSLPDCKLIAEFDN